MSKSGATGERLNEASNINKGLLQLGIVVKQLSEGDAHVPYRNSKLTFILKPSLGGNAKTAIICNMSPALVHRQDTSVTLQFATRAKQLKNDAVLNETLSNDALLKRQANQIEQLMKEAAASGCAPADSTTMLHAAVAWAPNTQYGLARRCIQSRLAEQ